LATWGIQRYFYRTSRDVREALSSSLTTTHEKNKLYGYTNAGTKKLIEEYIDEVCRQLIYIAEHPSPEMTLQTKINFFANIQRAFGRTALLLSGGGTFGGLLP
jgi:hypothetical protein